MWTLVFSRVSATVIVIKWCLDSFLEPEPGHVSMDVFESYPRSLLLSLGSSAMAVYKRTLRRMKRRWVHVRLLNDCTVTRSVGFYFYLHDKGLELFFINASVFIQSFTHIRVRSTPSSAVGVFLLREGMSFYKNKKEENYEGQNFDNKFKATLWITLHCKLSVILLFVWRQYLPVEM